VGRYIKVGSHAASDFWRPHLYPSSRRTTLKASACTRTMTQSTRQVCPAVLWHEQSELVEESSRKSGPEPHWGVGFNEDLPRRQAQTEEARTTLRRDPDVLEAHSWGVHNIHWPLTKGDACCYSRARSPFRTLKTFCLYFRTLLHACKHCHLLLLDLLRCLNKHCAVSMTPRAKAGLVLCNV